MTTLTVPGIDPYDVSVGRGAFAGIPELVGSDVRKVLIVHQPSLSVLAGELRANLSESYEVLLAEIPDGDDAKRVEVAAFCWQILGTADFTRSD
ncbi:MAG: 3-dehydroquinate synthase, partial [Terrimesophilobacter sp.]